MSHILSLRRFTPFFSVCVLLTAGSARAQVGLVNWESPHVSPIALTPSRDTLLAVNTADNRLEVFDVSSGLPVAIRSIPVGLDPVTVRARSESEAWVVNHVSDSISIVDLPTGRVVQTFQTGDEPTDVVFAGSPQRAFVSVSQLNQVRVFDPANLAAAPTTLNIQGEEPRAMAVSPDGSRVYVAIFESGNLTSAVRQQDVSNPAGPYGGQNPPPNAGNAFNPPIAAGLPAPPPVGMIIRRTSPGVWMDDNNHNWSQFVTWDLHDHDVAIIDSNSLAVSYATGMMTTVMGIGVKADGTVSIIGTEATNEKRFASNIQGTFIRCRIGSFNPASPATTSFADLNPHLNYLSPNVPVATRNLSIGDPRAIVWHPTTDQAYVAGMGSNNVIITNTAGTRLSAITVGEGPTGLALNAAASRLYVLNKFAGSISTIDTTTNLELSRVSFFDPTPTAIKIGRPMLYDTHRTSGLGQSSCASCHIDSRTDFLGWDLGNPQGSMKTVDQTCRQGPGACRDWHPMKGIMVTQSLQSIVGVEPFHWRGDKEDLAAFSVAFVDLQGVDAEPSATEMQQFTDFVSTIVYPPNPNRNIDGTFPATLPTTGGTNGTPNNGSTIFQTAATLAGGLRCIDCHALPNGTSGLIDDPRLPLAPQSLKAVQLRGLHEKIGWNRASANNSKGFGFNHHSEFDSLFALLNAGFNFPPGQLGITQRHDVEAFLQCLTNDTHAGVGQQVTFNGANNNNATFVTRFNSFISLADANQVGLVAKGRQQGVDRGYTYVGGNVFQSDRESETISATALQAAASAGNELTFTVVPLGTQVRIGIDRDSDGYYDRDEILGCGDPADAAITPVDKGDVSIDGNKDLADVPEFVSVLLDPASATSQKRCAADMNSDAAADSLDIVLFVQCVVQGICP